MEQVVDLADVIINDGSQLVFTQNQSAKSVLGDNRAVVYVVNGATVSAEVEWTTHIDVHENSSVILTSAESFTLMGTTTIRGHLGFNAPSTNTLHLTETAHLIIQSDAMNELSLHALTSLENSSVEILNAGVFSLKTTVLDIGGEFTVSGSLFLEPVITHFSVGPHGVVSFDPLTSGMTLGTTVDISGKVTLAKHVSFVGCDLFQISIGTIAWPSTEDLITIACDVVTINGPFSPGTVSFGSGVQTFTVGSNGTFEFIADGPIKADVMHIDGKMYVENLATFTSKSTEDSRINEITITHPNGSLVFNRGNLPEQEDSVPKESTCSTLHVRELSTNKVFNAGALNVGEGLDTINILTNGTWSLTPCDVFRVDTFISNGTFTSTTPITMRGKSLDKIRSLELEYGATMTFDSHAQSTKEWTGVSVLGVHEFVLNGDFNAGELQNFVTGNEGWDALRMNLNGSLYFLPNGPFYIDTLHVAGHFESYGALNMSSTDTNLIVEVGTTGMIKFDSLATSFVEESYVTASQIVMNQGSYWSAGNAVWDVTHLTVGGRLYCHPYRDTTVAYFTVGRTGTVDFSRPNKIQGIDYVIESGGRMDMFFQHTPDDVTQGCEATRLLYKTVTIAGTMQAGSLYIGHLEDGVQFCRRVEISGTLDVTGGGYLYDSGAGETFV